MATEVRFRRGNASEHEQFTGAPAEVTVNTSENALHVHDGSTPGGNKTVMESQIGTNPEQVPTNELLGTAAKADIGTNPEQVPTNAVITRNTRTRAISRLSGRFHVAAHRGREWGPENTLVAMSILPDMCRAVEFDVRITSDDQIVCIHDSSVNRTTNGSGNVESMTFSAIRALDAGSWYSGYYAGLRVPTGREYIEALRRRGTEMVLMDIKTIRSASDVEQYVEMIDELNAWDMIIAMVRGESEMALWRTVDERSLLGSFGVTLANDWLQAALDNNACLVLTPPGDGAIPTNAELYRQARAAGILVGASTTNIPAEFYEGAEEHGLDVILTDYPSTFVRYTSRGV